MLKTGETSLFNDICKTNRNCLKHFANFKSRRGKNVIQFCFHYLNLLFFERNHEILYLFIYLFIFNLFHEFSISCIRREYNALDEIFLCFFFILLRIKYKNKTRSKKNAQTQKNHDVFFFTHQQIFHVFSTITHTSTNASKKKTYSIQSKCTI